MLLTLYVLCILCEGLDGHSSGVILVKISSFLNPEGRDAAGSCCQRESGRDGRAVDDDVHQWIEHDDVHPWADDGFSDGFRSGRGGGGTCSAPCYTMFRVCASRVDNESLVVLPNRSPQRGSDPTEAQELYGADQIRSKPGVGLVQPAPGVERIQAIPGAGRIQPQTFPQNIEKILTEYTGRATLPPRISSRYPPNPKISASPRPPYRHPPRPQNPPGLRGDRPRPRPLSYPPRPLPGPEERLGRPARPWPRPQGRPVRPQHEPEGRMERPGEGNMEYSVVWRQDRSLFTPSLECAYGSLTTEVIFNSSLQGSGDLLVKIPFQESWNGVFSLSIEAWHINKPKRIPQPIKEAKTEKEQSFLEKIFSTLATSITSNIKKLAEEKIAEAAAKAEEKEDTTTQPVIDETTMENINENNSTSSADQGDNTTRRLSEDSTDHEIDLSTTETSPETTSAEAEIEETSEILEDEKEETIDEQKDQENRDKDYDDDESLYDRGKLILRLERNHLLYAGEDWNINDFSTYHARIDYGVKLVCAHNFTGETCSFAKLCRDKIMQNNPRMYCTADGEVVCRAGWVGEVCDKPVCAPGCHATQGYCSKPGECKCKTGYTGGSCQKCIKMPGCLHGECTTGFECVCRPGYTGIFCNKPVCSQGCNTTNAYCKVPDTCTCRGGWRGANCTECTPGEGCKHGSCTKPGECNCNENFTGLHCDKPICSEDCSEENGYCTQPGDCTCRVGWEGRDCKQCSKYPGCLNGYCSEPWDCLCKEGWTGDLCDEVEVIKYTAEVRVGRCTPTSQFRCMNGGEDECVYSNNGTRIGEPVCRCTDQFQGRFCQYKISTVQENNSDIPNNHVDSSLAINE
ncbi:uncharacterized protein LOC111707298 isoform X2 [Eurytemora carolleeae]|uniref:uncharacterized protein LOC111707298 isoform X2 n=1 Tax=Eurytemora carolleeae TaxID=1294199 RepID=UPI000C7705DD|nr:uncharacterized protein LOC111707298 isoform X2 [Eurytemora carolleeae]|eukprot:XP_023336148.1 uncharacterized protein LOC111707298 isoform X2 [Eurytemora affinis]